MESNKIAVFVRVQLYRETFCSLLSDPFLCVLAKIILSSKTQEFRLKIGDEKC